MLTLGSLFDGSGGFPLAAQNVGIEPIWASEIEPFPVRVTRKRFPSMRHLGDVTKVKGGDIEPVDIITFGSPCQSFSLAGSRAGLNGQSGLFFEAIRIAKEMRAATDNRKPDWLVFENVPGALNCSGGDDYRQILQEFFRLAGVVAECPGPKKWETVGSVMAEGFSLAWRVFNAKYFGVAQQRRRVFLVFHFENGYGGGGAQEVLIEREGVKGYPAEGLQKGKSMADCTTGDCVETDSRGVTVEYQPTDSRIKLRKDDTFQTLCSRMGTGGNTTPLVLENVPIALTRASFFTLPLYNLMHPLVATDSKEAPLVLVSKTGIGGGTLPFLRRITPLECARLQGFPDDWCDALEDENPSDEDVAFFQHVWDEWNDIRGVKHKTEKQVRTWLAAPPTDKAMYKLWGNGVALPCVEFILRGIVNCQ